MITGVKCKRNSALTESIEKNRSTKQRLKQAKGITLIALVITIVLNCCRSGRYHIKETNLINILEKKINLL